MAGIKRILLVRYPHKPLALFTNAATWATRNFGINLASFDLVEI